MWFAAEDQAVQGKKRERRRQQCRRDTLGLGKGQVYTAARTRSSSRSVMPSSAE